MRSRHTRRPGFTLVELMVAMSLAVVLAGLAVGVVYSTGAIGSQRVVGAADRVSGWLVTAKQRAIRDGNAQGVRFYLTNGQVTEAQYIEKPLDPVVPNPDGDPNGARIVFRYRDANGDGIVQPTEKEVFYFRGTTGPAFSASPGDYLMLSEFGTSYRLDPAPTADTVEVGGSPESVTKLILADFPDLGAGHSTPTGPEATHVTSLFAFQPQPRPLFGEPILQVGQDAIIDWRTSPATTIGFTASPATTDHFDVMFASNGQMSANGATSVVALWLRDPTKATDPYDFGNAGEQVLVVIYPKTGAISTCLVNPDASDPHKNAREGVNTGV